MKRQSHLTRIPPPVSGAVNTKRHLSLLPLLALCALSLSVAACGETTVTVECPEGATTLYCSILLADDDHDGVPDGIDNCTDVTNPDQADSDGDGVGDACEAGALPNIPDTPGTPDVPDVPAPGEDSDGDGVLDSEDNCPTTANPDQADSNGNGAGDACEEVVVPEQPDEPEPSDPPIETPEQDSDGDGVPDVSDGCPTDAAKTSAGQCGCGVADTDSDGDGTPNCKDGCPSDAAKTSAGKCGCGVADTDSDGDGVPNCKDNCPNKANANQADYNSDGVGDACTTQNGTVTYPFIISPPSEHYVFTDVRDTADATSDAFDTYPPTNTDESGKEFIYAFKVAVPTYFAAEVQAPEPSGVDIDLQILSSLKSAQLLNNDKVNRDDKRVTAKLQPGVYYLTADSYAGKHGEYVLDATFRPVNVKESDLFNSYILKAVDRIEKNWSMLGYASAAFTHDLNYGGKGTVTASNAPYTMCVAAATEVLLVAMQIYAEETGDTSVWDFLPVSSWKSLNTANFRAHIWCNHDINTYGSADALRHFGMGQTVPFSELKPGSFINLNRSSGSGHAVVFLSFLDAQGNKRSTYSSDVVGFMYYSSQGSKTNGGFDYRCAFWEDVSRTLANDCAGISGDRAMNTQTNQDYLNTGMVYAPSKWLKTSWSPSKKLARKGPAPWAGLESVFDEEYFNGVTIDD